jgi:hypothetical protein
VSRPPEHFLGAHLDAYYVGDKPTWLIGAGVVRITGHQAARATQRDGHRGARRGGPSMLTAVQGVLTVGAAVLLAVGGFVWVQRRVHVSVREPQNDIAGFVYAVLGVQYAVVLAFCVIVVWQEFDAARLVVESEAGALTDVYGLAQNFPEPQRQRTQEAARSYARLVVEEEWPLLANGQESRRASDLLQEIRGSIHSLEPKTPKEQVLYDHGLIRSRDLLDNRRLRLYYSRQGIPTALWMVLVPGGVITITFTYFFGLRNTRAHALMIALLTMIIVGTIFLIRALDFPFTGDVRVEPDSFKEALRMISDT